MDTVDGAKKYFIKMPAVLFSQARILLFGIPDRSVADYSVKNGGFRDVHLHNMIFSDFHIAITYGQRGEM